MIVTMYVFVRIFNDGTVLHNFIRVFDLWRRTNMFVVKMRFGRVNMDIFDDFDLFRMVMMRQVMVMMLVIMWWWGEVNF